MNLITSLAMKILSFGSSSLGGTLLDNATAKIPENSQYSFILPIIRVLDTALVPIMIVLLAAGTIYSIVLGVNMAKAESSDKREEAKKRMINAIVGFGLIIVLLVVVYALMANIDLILGIAENGGVETTSGNSGSTNTGAFSLLRMFLR